MKRNKLSDSDKGALYRNAEQGRRCIAYHEAGHAAAIYLNNKARGMPPVFFHLSFNEAEAASEDSVMNYQKAYSDYIGRVEGGRLIQSLPASFAGLDRQLAENIEPHLKSVSDYGVAFDLDIINLLAGPLAEAKYVAVNDGELFNHRLVNLPALKNYGGRFDLVLIDDYLHSFSRCKQQRAEKLNELFLIAFHFVSDYHNWKAITKLAEYIIESNKKTISYEKAVATLG
jgi:hypothetical protein